MKRILQNLTIALGSLVVTFAICEVGARILVPAPMGVKVTSTKIVPNTQAQKDVYGADGQINSVIDWSGKHGVRLYPNVTGHIQNHSLSKQDVIIRTNALGFRGGDIGPRQPGQYRILLIGDSIIFGDYVDETLTIPYMLEQKLKSLGYTNVVVMNAGLPGINLAQEYQHYQEVFEAADVDLVLLAMYLNDAQEAHKFYARTLRFPFSSSRFLTWVVQRFQLVDSDALFGKVRLPTTEKDWREKFKGNRDLKSGNSLGNRDGFDFEIYNAANDFGLAWNPVSWEQLTRISKLFVGLVRQNKTKFAAFIFPVAMQVYAKSEVLNTYPQEQFEQLFTSLNVPNYDILPVLRAKSSEMGMKEMFYDHCHYRAEGNQIVADTVADWLVKDSLVSK